MEVKTITIDEAIKPLDEWYPECSLALHPNFPKAVKLGAEALKRIKDFRETGNPQHLRCLPGETKE